MPDITKLKIVILGEPFAKQADKSRIIEPKAGKSFIHHYTEKKIVREESNVRAQIVQQLPPGFVPFSGPVRIVRSLFVFTPPATLRRWEQEQLAKGGLLWKSTKPDLNDNLMKGLCDAMQGVVYLNDSRICDIGRNIKAYGLRPRIEMEIEEIKDRWPVGFGEEIPERRVPEMAGLWG